MIPKHVLECDMIPNHVSECDMIPNHVLECDIIPNHVSECDMIPNRNTRCRGFCNRVRVGKTNNVMQCIQKCLERDKCRHYIWYRPGTFWGKTCFVVEGEGSVYRDSSKLTITGSCRKGNTSGYNF